MQRIYLIIGPRNGIDRTVVSKKQEQKNAVLLAVCLVRLNKQQFCTMKQNGALSSSHF